MQLKFRLTVGIGVRPNIYLWAYNITRFSSILLKCILLQRTIVECGLVDGWLSSVFFPINFLIYIVSMIKLCLNSEPEMSLVQVHSVV